MGCSAPLANGLLTYVGHATTLIELDGTRLLTDPVLGARILHIRRLGATPDVPPRLDAILVSHAHYDHLDLPSLRSLPTGVPVIAPYGVASLVEQRTGHHVTGVAPGERVRVGSGDGVATPAVHDGTRLRFTRDLGAVGFVVEGTARVYFAGDTDVFDGMRGLAEDIDIALLPVWGWGPDVGPGHLDPEGAAKAAALLAPKVAVPIHWGTYLPYGLERKHGRLLHEPVADFRRHAERLAPQVNVIVPQVGVPIEL